MKNLKKISAFCFVFYLLVLAIAPLTMGHSEMNSSNLWCEAPTHEPLPVLGVEIIGEPMMSHDAEYYPISINNTTGYYISGRFFIEKELKGKWFSLNTSTGEFSHLLFRNGIDGLTVEPFSSNSSQLNLDAFLPERTPGNYRVVWTGFAKVPNQDVQADRINGCLFLPFTLRG